MRIELTIEQDDIWQGVRGDPDRCPIALAARRTFPGAEVIAVCGDGIEIVAFGDTYVVALPEPTQYFILLFDRGDTVAPLTIPLEFPDHLKLKEALAI
jgi:hypothetical protein